jgi:UDPglucose 6-dehydrogenase
VRLAVIGCGYVGLVTGSCLAEAGHEVIATDNDEARIRMLSSGRLPIYEPGLDPVGKVRARHGA